MSGWEGKNKSKIPEQKNKNKRLNPDSWLVKTVKFAFVGAHIGHRERKKARQQQRTWKTPIPEPLVLTIRGERVFEHLIELGQVHHHGQLVRLPDWGHLFACHDGRNAQFLFSNIKGQLVILLHILIIQRIKISEKQNKKNLSRISVFPTPENSIKKSPHFLVAQLKSYVQCFTEIWEQTWNINHSQGEKMIKDLPI